MYSIKRMIQLSTVKTKSITLVLTKILFLLQKSKISKISLRQKLVYLVDTYNALYTINDTKINYSNNKI